MQRESAIADDFWHSMLEHRQKHQIEITLENLERK